MTNLLVPVMAFDAERGGGSVRIAYDIATLLAQRGYPVTVVCEDLFGSGVEKETSEGITVLRYRLPRAIGLGISRHREHIQAVKRLLIKHLTGPPEVIHGHHPFQYYAALELFGKQSRCCYTIHSPAIEELRITWGAQGIRGMAKSLFGLPIIKKLESSLLDRSAVVASESSYTTELIARHYGDEAAKKIRVIPGWVDPDKFRPLQKKQIEPFKRQLGWPIDVPVFLVLRRLEPRMGLDNLLRAVKCVKKRGFKLHVAIGGSGSLRAHLEKLREVLDLKNEVTFMGFVPDNLLPIAYGACDASVVPTAKLECFGIIVLEALASGRTTLVTPVGALPEVMRKIELEWISRNATAEGIADLMIAFLQGRLPVHPPEELHGLMKREYSSEKAVNAYERLLFP